MTTASIEASDDRLLVKGVLDFSSVIPLRQQGINQLQQNRSLTVDLQGVEHSNSAGVALLLEWLRYAKQQDKSIQFINLPEQMQAVARVCGLTGILPVAE